MPERRGTMEKSLREEIISGLEQQKGHVGFYYKNMVTGDTLAYRDRDRFSAASVIKLPVFMILAKLAAEGRISMEDKIRIRDEDKVPICGALTLFTDEPLCDIRTLCRLMISISDNTATNVLIDYLGVTRYQEESKKIGLTDTLIARKIYDSEATARGLVNFIVPAEMAFLLEKIYRRAFVSPEVSKEIEDILMLQQINHKICGRIGWDYPVAHKTGEEDDTTHDVGLVYARQPFVCCFTSNNTDVPTFEDFIRRVSEKLVRVNDQ